MNIYKTKELTKEEKNQYYLIVKQKMINLSFGVHNISALVYKENEPLYIECVKILIDRQIPQSLGFNIDFNKDFTRLKKFESIT